ncbi:MAG: VCBS repeat-containing protein [Sedimentisphaerales bacterium]|nr:VCBS repeat-containing protein [Sedimentisphaerales bacterium]
MNNTKYRNRIGCLLALGILAGMVPAGAVGDEASPKAPAADAVTFQKIVLDKAFRSEGVAVGDVNRDGRLDVLAGEVWYAAGDWTMHEIRPAGQYDPAKGYSKTFCQFAQDVNGDGWIDSIVTTMMGEPCTWYENPGKRPGHWTERIAARSACNETPLFADLLGDGRPVPVFGVQPAGYIAWYSLPPDPTQPWDQHIIAGPKAPGSERYSHGLGVGDVNGDGRNDVLVTAGWWEAPPDRKQEHWPFHPADLAPDCADMVVLDVDGDGDGDILTSSAHSYGIWWFEQSPGAEHPRFQRHEITRDFSQTHALILADINGDGALDFVTGKRYYAHNGNDPGSHEPAVIYWFEIQRTQNGAVRFVRHPVDDDSGIGTQFRVVDMNGDGKLDIVTANKKGVHLFIQRS